MDRIILSARARMLAHFVRRFHPVTNATILDVGTSPAPELESSNLLLQWRPSTFIHCCGIDPPHPSWSHRYPGIGYTQANGLCLPFDDGQFDLIHCNAVIEHVGHRLNQEQLVNECLRVARRGVFLTTPNRWHPIEFHTLLPFVHWLPKRLHRAILSALGLRRFATEECLNLLDAKSLRSIGHAAADQHGDTIAEVTVRSTRLGGLPSNLLLVIDKRSRHP